MSDWRGIGMTVERFLDEVGAEGEAAGLAAGEPAEWEGLGSRAMSIMLAERAGTRRHPRRGLGRIATVTVRLEDEAVWLVTEVNGSSVSGFRSKILNEDAGEALDDLLRLRSAQQVIEVVKASLREGGV